MNMYVKSNTLHENSWQTYYTQLLINSNQVWSEDKWALRPNSQDPDEDSYLLYEPNHCYSLFLKNIISY